MTKTVHSDTYPAIDPTAHPKEKLAGRAVFVSGASRGIGKAIAVSFARAGASKIAITGRGDLSAVADEVKAAARAAGRGEPAVLCVELEVSSQASVEAAAALVGREFGRCDVVVSNAGVFGTPSRIGEVADADAWWRVYEVNVRGQFLTARSFVPLLAGTPGGLGTFITVASVGAHLVSPGSSQYHPGKTMNLRFAEHIDAEYAAEGVSAWCVHPGNVLTGEFGIRSRPAAMDARGRLGGCGGFAFADGEACP